MRDITCDKCGILDEEGICFTIATGKDGAGSPICGKVNMCNVCAVKLLCLIVEALSTDGQIQTSLIVKGYIQE